MGVLLLARERTPAWHIAMPSGEASAPSLEGSTCRVRATLLHPPVRAKPADIRTTGDLDVMLFQRGNSSRAHIVNADASIGMMANSCAIRYGDNAWKYFLDTWTDHMVGSGLKKERDDHCLGELADG